MSGNTLTDRYVHEVVRRIPADQRADVADELRTTIADTADARDEADPAAAERAVITEMGDPIRLAAKYADRPLALIGPGLYPAYIRLLKLLLTTVLPIVVAVLVVIEVLDTNDVGSAIGAAIGGLFAVGAQMIAWLTVVFALIERSQQGGLAASTVDQWTPDDLPELRQTEKRDHGAAAAVGWNALVIALIVWQHTAEPYRAGSDRIEVLDPALWSGWIWPILIGLAAIVTLDVIRFATGRRSMLDAGLYTVAQVVFALPLAWILWQQQFFNPVFLTHFNNGWTTPDAIYTISAIVVLLVSGSEIISRFRDTRSQS
ncbi:HAAS signaling domain-containing protein [Kribbella deserti]|uniref:Permease prefix domain 1-containing protein n=1 Tax=Kribbella deserti TaxID=1926257 RepID=A0ABV6QXR9_9ACTN